MIPISTDTSIRRTPWVNYGLVAANVFVFILPYFEGMMGRNALNATQAIRVWLGAGALNGPDPQLYQFFTYQFLHANFAHLAGNMLFLWVFGNAVNAKMGHGPYLLFYLASGVFAAAGYSFSHSVTLVGASGSIAAVTGAFLALFPRSRITILYWFYIIGTFELPAVVMIVFKLILWDNILAPQMIGESNVAFSAHLSGYALGFGATVLMLALRALPRDQFDIVALWRRWFQRQSMATMINDPVAQARAQFGRVARPVTVEVVPTGTAPAAVIDPLTEIRKKIEDALAFNDRTNAALFYEQLLEMDPRQVLPREDQLCVGNQLYTLNRLPQAAATYEKYLNHYAPSAEADQVRLLLGIIYARDLHQYEVAEGHLSQLVGRLHDPKREEQCRQWLNISLQALGRPTLEPGNDH